MTLRVVNQDKDYQDKELEIVIEIMKLIEPLKIEERLKVSIELMITLVANTGNFTPASIESFIEILKDEFKEAYMAYSGLVIH